MAVTNGVISTYLKDKIINHVLRNIAYTPPSNVFIALYTSNPTADNTGTEVAGNAYARVQTNSTYWTYGTGQTSNVKPITFPAASGSWGNITHVGVMTANTSGSLLFFCPLENGAVTVNSGDIFNIGTGKILFNLQYGGYGIYLATKIMDSIFINSAYTSPGTDVYLSLYTTSASMLYSGQPYTEVSTTSTGYSRKQVAGSSEWNAPTSGCTANTNSITFTTSALADWGTVRSLIIYDKATGDSTTGTNVLFYDDLDSPKIILQGDAFAITSGSLKLNADYYV